MSWIRKYISVIEDIDIDYVENLKKNIEELEKFLPGIGEVLDTLSKDEVWVVEYIVEIFKRYKEMFMGEYENNYSRV